MNNTENRIVLGNLRYKSSPDVDYSVKIPLEQTSKNYIEYDRNLNVNLEEVFERERQTSTVFRPSCKITFIMYNAYTGTTSYKPFQKNLYLVNEDFYRDLQIANPNGTNTWGGFPSYNEFDLIRTDYNVSGYTQPPDLHIPFVSKSASTYNWNFFLSYAYSADTTKQLIYYIDSNTSISWVVSDGIPFEIDNSVSNGVNLITLKCPVKHGVNVGEYVQLNGFQYNGNDVFEVYSLGNGLYGTDEYYINIYNYGYTGSTFSNGYIGTLKRIIDVNNSAETKSSYYVRRHLIITDVDDAILVKSGFELNNFSYKVKYQTSALTPDYKENIVTRHGNQTYTLSFTKDIDVNGLLDNQKRPVSELFFTKIHRGYFGWFYPSVSFKIRQGFGFNLDLQNSNPNQYWTLTSTLNMSNDLTLSTYNSAAGGSNFNYVTMLKSGDTIDGDFCEWNEFEQTERVISELYYKLIFNNSNFRVDVSINPRGYYYSPHTPFKIRSYSSYIEEGENKETFDVPDYAVYSKFRGTFRWRDIYTYGFIDGDGNGVDYPFLNGVHYPYKNTIFRLIPEGSNYSEIPYGVQDPLIDDCE